MLLDLFLLGATFDKGLLFERLFDHQIRSNYM